MSVIKKVVIWILCLAYVAGIGFYGFTKFIPKYFREKLHYDSQFSGDYVEMSDEDLTITLMKAKEIFPIIEESGGESKNISIREILKTDKMEINEFSTVNLSDEEKLVFLRKGYDVTKTTGLAHVLINYNEDNIKGAYLEDVVDYDISLRGEIKEYLYKEKIYQNVIYDGVKKKRLVSFEDSYIYASLFVSSVETRHAFYQPYIITKWSTRSKEQLIDLGVKFYKEKTENDIKIKAVLTKEYVIDIFKGTIWYELAQTLCASLLKMNDVLYFIFDKNYTLKGIRYDIDNVFYENNVLGEGNEVISIEYIVSEKDINYDKLIVSDYNIE